MSLIWVRTHAWVFAYFSCFICFFFARARAALHRTQHTHFFLSRTALTNLDNVWFFHCWVGSGVRGHAQDCDLKVASHKSVLHNREGVVSIVEHT